MRLGVTEYFDSAHYLPGHKTCGQTHGHTYTVELIVEGEKRGAGMVVDFYDLKSVLKKVLSEYDHRLINEIIEYPSVENISQSIYEKLQGQIELPFMVRVWEGRGKWCEMGDL
jgi:6-pyruvoyltetrahydropterin/6-carboxytetrahydropterin synthase